jgi:antitoxin HicB
MKRTYTFVFDPDPDGGFVVTCPALPGLVTHGDTIEEARMMARDAMEGYVAVLVEDGEQVPEMVFRWCAHVGATINCTIRRPGDG